MMRVVLDANVIVSAAIKGGGMPDQIVRRAGDKFVWLASEFILAEVTAVLNRRRLWSKYRAFATPAARAQFVEALREAVEIVHVTSRLQLIPDDAEDNPILACALDGKAEYLVTGDRHLLQFGSYAAIQIVSPAQFLRLLD